MTTIRSEAKRKSCTSRMEVLYDCHVSVLSLGGVGEVDLCL